MILVCWGWAMDSRVIRSWTTWVASCFSILLILDSFLVMLSFHSSGTWPRTVQHLNGSLCFSFSFVYVLYSEAGRHIRFGPTRAGKRPVPDPWYAIDRDVRKGREFSRSHPFCSKRKFAFTKISKLVKVKSPWCVMIRRKRARKYNFLVRNAFGWARNVGRVTSTTKIACH